MTEYKEIKDGKISHCILYKGEDDGIQNFFLNSNRAYSFLLDEEIFYIKDENLAEEYNKLQNGQGDYEAFHNKIQKYVNQRHSDITISDFYDCPPPHLFQVKRCI